MSKQAEIDFTLDARDRGAQQAVDHANAVESEWSGQALGLLVAYAIAHPGPFLTEDARPWAEAQGLPPPPDPRAWGQVVKRARAKGRLRKTGEFAISRVSKSPKPLWTYAQ